MYTNHEKMLVLEEICPTVANSNSMPMINVSFLILEKFL